MGDSIAGHNISSNNIRNTAIIVDLNAAFFSFYEINSFASDGLYRASGNGSGRYFSGDNMSQDNFLLLLSGQRVQNLRIDLTESFIGGSKNGQSFSSLQSVDQTQFADNGDQSLERTSTDGNINNVSKGFLSSGVNHFGFLHGHRHNFLHHVVRVVVDIGHRFIIVPWFPGLVVGAMRHGRGASHE